MYVCEWVCVCYPVSVYVRGLYVGSRHTSAIDTTLLSAANGVESVETLPDAVTPSRAAYPFDNGLNLLCVICDQHVKCLSEANLSPDP